MVSDKDPIVARSSAPGRGGIGVVRISGTSKQVNLISQILFPQKELKPRYAHLLSINDTDGHLIDRAIVIRFFGPSSYTGEDVLEIQAHGGPALQQVILERCLQAGREVGLRTAEPGEFTKRAFLNNRMDLAQAEAVADLIEANSSAAVRAAARSLQGEFSKRIHDINTDLLELRAYIEATIDFPEEEIDFIESGHVNERVAAIAQKLVQLQNAAMRGKVLREGLTVVLAGAPNVGKSSLMNALACDDVAIVTNIAGTTRDRITHTIHLDGLAVNLIDTAGVRHTDNEVERIGIERTLQSVETADIVLLLRSADQAESREEEAKNNLLDYEKAWSFSTSSIRSILRQKKLRKTPSVSRQKQVRALRRWCRTSRRLQENRKARRGTSLLAPVIWTAWHAPVSTCTFLRATRSAAP